MYSLLFNFKNRQLSLNAMSLQCQLSSLCHLSKKYIFSCKKINTFYISRHQFRLLWYFPPIFTKMILSLLLCNVLFIPIVFGNTNPVKVGSDLKSLPTKVNSEVDLKKNISLTPIMTEGGAVIASTPLTLLKQNHSTLLSLDKEMDVGKSVQSTGSNVVARKGVTLPSNTTVAPPVSVEIKLLDDNKNNTQKNTKTKIEGKDSKQQSLSTQPTLKQNKTVVKTPIKQVDKVESPKKPLVLSNEDLDKMDVMDDIYVPSTHVTSTGNKLQQMEANRQVGVVMPVVITILVVPLFAVLGYIALRRGREAWKNRHYKRMDFLLDGMYNE